jgi:hypothetical protein
VATRPAVAQDPFVYFAGNPANAWYTVGGTCDGLTLTANYLFFISGDVNSASLPARWTALPFEICAPMTFDSIVYMPGLTTGAPNLRVWITGSQAGPAGTPQPNLNDIKFAGDFGAYPGDPPSVPSDVAIRTYYGGTTTFTYLRTTPLGQSLTLQPGLYFAIIVGDEDFATGGPFDSYIALSMGAPGGPKLYYDPRGQGSQNLGGILAPSIWQRFRYNTSVAPFTCERILNTDLPYRSGDPFANTPPWNGVPDWNRYHSPMLYNGVLGFRNSAAQPGKVTGTAVTADVGSPSPPTNVEVIFYRPGTKQRVARFSQPTAAGPSFPIDTLEIQAGTYDVVVRPIYSPTIVSVNCPTNICVTGVSFSPDRHWLGVRIPNVNVSGTVDLGTVILPNGDTNGDLVIDDADLLTVLFAFGTSDDAADLNEDGVVDDADLLIVLFNFGAQGEDGDETCN